MYDLMVPVIFAMNLFGGKMEWKRSRQACAAPPSVAVAVAQVSLDKLHLHPAQLCFNVGLPIVIAAFLLVWHVVRTPLTARMRPTPPTPPHPPPT
jgi:hypothetical protein